MGNDQESEVFDFGKQWGEMTPEMRREEVRKELRVRLAFSDAIGARHGESREEAEDSPIEYPLRSVACPTQEAIHAFAAQSIQPMLEATCCLGHAMEAIADFMGQFGFAVGYRMGLHGVPNEDVEHEWSGFFREPTEEEIDARMQEIEGHLKAKGVGVMELLRQAGIDIQDVKEDGGGAVILTGDQAEKAREILSSMSHSQHDHHALNEESNATGMYL